MKKIYTLAALAALAAVPAHAAVPDGCAPVIANWQTAPTYSCKGSDNSAHKGKEVAPEKRDDCPEEEKA